MHKNSLIEVEIVGGVSGVYNINELNIDMAKLKSGDTFVLYPERFAPKPGSPSAPGGTYTIVNRALNAGTDHVDVLYLI